MRGECAAQMWQDWPAITAMVLVFFLEEAMASNYSVKMKFLCIVSCYLCETCSQ